MNKKLKPTPQTLKGGGKEQFGFFIGLGQTLRFWGEALFCVETSFDDAHDNTLLLREAGSFLGSLERRRGRGLEGRRQWEGTQVEEEQEEASSLGLNRMCLDLTPCSSLFRGFPGGAEGKNQPTNAGDPGDVDWIPGSGRSPGAENGNPFQCSCLEDSMGRGTWKATVHGAEEALDMTEHTHNLFLLPEDRSGGDKSGHSGRLRDHICVLCLH